MREKCNIIFPKINWNVCNKHKVVKKMFCVFGNFGSKNNVALPFIFYFLNKGIEYEGKKMN